MTRSLLHTVVSKRKRRRSRFGGPQSCRAIVSLAFVLFLIAGATSPCLAQEIAKVATEKWRPKDGLYAAPDKDFEMRCGEYGHLVVGLKGKSVSGHEWGCKINRLTEIAPSTVKLNMTCSDLNLAVDLKMPEDTDFKEILLIKRINENSISVRRTLNGKLEHSAWRADYCPDGAQRMYAEKVANERSRNEYKIPEQLLRPNQWRPKDGIYASTGPDFSDRCAKSGDVAIGLFDGSISSGRAKCKVVEVMNTGQAAMSLNMTCSQSSEKQAPSLAKKALETDARREPGTHSLDVIRMSRIDDNTFHMQRTMDRKFRDDGGPVAYCPEEAQRAYAARKASK